MIHFGAEISRSPARSPPINPCRGLMPRRPVDLYGSDSSTPSSPVWRPATRPPRKWPFHGITTSHRSLPPKMAVSPLSSRTLSPLPPPHVDLRRPGAAARAAAVAFPRKEPKLNQLDVSYYGQRSKWALRLSLAEQSPPKPAVDVERLVGFLYDDLPHLFDDQGIDRTAYDERVKFRDPITKHDTISGYLFNIAFLKTVFRPDFQLHWAKQTGPYEITTRWTMVMKFMPLPWKPELVFTGTSIMGINSETGKFCSHVDYWDSIKENEYFSLEGLRDVFRQLQYYKTPELQSPIYQILKRTGKYEVRKYAPFLVAETSGDKLSGSKGFNDIAGYIFGKNSKMEKMKMTTPVFTQAFDNELSKISIQFVLPLEKDLSSVPDPSQKNISLRQVDDGIAAVLKFSGEPTEDIVLEKERELRSSLLRDGLKPKMGCLFARYNDPGRTWSFTLRNEVLIWLEEFELEYYMM